VTAAAARVVADEHHALLERLAARVGDEVLALDDRIAAVTVAIRKLRPPVPFDLATAGVRLTRTR
jgi:dihydroneopterin aldolase